jgi:hypothetical protein
MAAFTLTDIKFNAPKGPTGPLTALQPGTDMSNTFRYPEDVGSGDKGHYMIININQQRLTGYPEPTSGVTPTAIANARELGGLSAGTSQVTSALGSIGAEGSIAVSYVVNRVIPQVANFFNNPQSAFNSTVTGAAKTLGGIANTLTDELFKTSKQLQTGSIRASKRIVKTIALYMPDTIAFMHQQDYGEVGAGGQGLTALASAGKSLVEVLQSDMNAQGMATQITKNLSPFLASMLAKKAGGLGQIAFAQGMGIVQNPMLEVLYSSPKFRTFRFDFQFYPRSEKEAMQVMSIIEMLRFHQAPEVAQNGTSGFFMVPPSEFDISFYYNGQINPNIPAISTCVLDSLELDFAPGGFSAYEIPGQPASRGGTGMPVSIRMGLQFKETEIMTKSSYTGREYQSPFKADMVPIFTPDNNSLAPGSYES